MPLTRTTILPLVTLGLAFAATASAAEPRKLECVRINESAQDLRHAGKLREAIEQFEACSRRSCPKVLREDCVESAAEARAAQPRVLLTAKDAHDGTAVPIRVRIDGGDATTETGKLTLDPGDHDVEIRADGYAPVTKKIRLEEKQDVSVVIDLEKEARAAIEVTLPPPPVETPSSGSTQRTLSYVLGGAGIVALGVGSYFGLAASSTYDDAVKGCDPARGGRRACSGSALEKGDDADGQALMSTISFIAGGVLLTGALALFLTAPKDTRSAFGPIRWDFAYAGRP